MIRWEWYFFQSPNCLPQLWKLPPQLKRTASLSLLKSIWMEDDEIVLSLLMGYLAHFQNTKNDQSQGTTGITGSWENQSTQKGAISTHPAELVVTTFPGETEVISTGTFGWVRGSAIGQGAHACVAWIHQIPSKKRQEKMCLFFGGRKKLQPKPWGGGVMFYFVRLSFFEVQKTKEVRFSFFWGGGVLLGDI